jgi:IclR family KDG regulon transcriptional repressor
MGLEPASSRTYPNQSLARAFAILACFSLRLPTLTLQDICSATALPKPTVFRLLAALETARLVARTPDKQRYQIGIRAFELGSLFLSSLSIERLARPVMEEISKQLGMACNLAILDDGQVVYVAITDPRAPLLQRPIIGYRHYVHCSALGKALVAPLSDAEIRSIVQRRGMPALSPYTLTTPDALLADLHKVREQGYALDNQEGGAGICCLAAPIYDHSRSVAAAISVSAPSPLVTGETMPQIVAVLSDGAHTISRQLGWDGVER